MNSPIEKTGYKVLLDSGAVSKDILDRIYRESENSELSFSQNLVKSDALKELDLLTIYANGFGIPYLNLKSAQVEKSVFDKVPVKFATYYKFFPIRLQNRRLTIAVSRLIDVHLLDEIRFGLGYEIELVFSLERDIEDGLKQHYGLAADTVERILNQSAGDRTATTEPVSTQEVQDIERLAETPSVIQLVNQILLEAYKKRASDVHLEPFRGKIRLRYRIDGILQEQAVPPELKKFFTSILSRIKIMANLNIVEKRLPQDGKARVRTQDKTLDLRISSIPTPHGESMVIRILPGDMILRFDQLGFEEFQLKIYQELIHRPNGILFLTGPTGSGKSTTLYAGLHALNSIGRKIITIEDPVEYEMEGITQLQVAPDIGLTFARGLRSMLRHDPDVMMVGEVRDLETADIAIRVALTGHLILSTLHTNDAASGVTRLLDIGVEPYLVASSVMAFIAQRLVRVICPHCKQENTPFYPEIKEILRRDLGSNVPNEVKIFKGQGCDECHGTGFRGRTAIHEVLVLNEEIRKLILLRTSSDQIKAKAIEFGMTTLRQNGWKKVLAGITTPEEIIQAAPEDAKWEERSSSVVPVSPGEDEILISQEGEIKNTNVSGGEEKSLEERRSYPRVKIDIPVKYRIIDLDKGGGIKDWGDQWDQRGKIDDLSASGIAFLTANPLNQGVLLELRIELPDGDRPIQCIGRIIRVERLLKSFPTGAEFFNRIAITFLAIPSGDRSRIENFCKTQLPMT